MSLNYHPAIYRITTAVSQIFLFVFFLFVVFKTGRGVKVFAERKSRGKENSEVKLFSLEDFC